MGACHELSRKLGARVLTSAMFLESKTRLGQFTATPTSLRVRGLAVPAFLHTERAGSQRLPSHPRRCLFVLVIIVVVGLGIRRNKTPKHPGNVTPRLPLRMCPVSARPNTDSLAVPRVERPRLFQPASRFSCSNGHHFPLRTNS